MAANIGVPIKVLHEAEGHTVTVETMAGELYKGKLISAEDNMNVQLEGCTVTSVEGQTSCLDNIVIRGTRIRLIALPAVLKETLTLKNMTERRGGSARGGGGRPVYLRAQAVKGKKGLRRGQRSAIKK